MFVLLGSLPLSALGALLVFAGLQLALRVREPNNRRAWWVIGSMGGATFWLAGLVLVYLWAW